MEQVRVWLRVAGKCIVVTSLPLVLLTTPLQPHAVLGDSTTRCAAVATSSAVSVQAGRNFRTLAYLTLDRDRSRYAGLAPLRHSNGLSAIAERHSAYMASIGNWSDGDPEGDVLSRVHAAGIPATYAGQNVVTANGSTVLEAISQGEAFFAQEASGGGPHWSNITNPNHHYVGMGVALLGSPGSYTIYLTQVFADAGGCGATTADTISPATTISSNLHVGVMAHPAVDALQLRTEPAGQVLATLRAGDHLQVVDLQDKWAQVKVVKTGIFGWVFAPFLTVE